MQALQVLSHSWRLNNICVVVLNCFSRVQLFATLWTVVRQAPLSVGFSRQEYWRGLPFPPLGDLPDPGVTPAFPALAGRFFTPVPPGQPSVLINSAVYLVHQDGITPVIH